ncbi:tetratricopeptide repeat protein [Bradyrhizobium sp. B124]|uniref:tetratricopeptide repeat protein n=1 Tax=Bradyrhizobium sp. B124 TaxID=3140245 RepID=UPI0031841540
MLVVTGPPNSFHDVDEWIKRLRRTRPLSQVIHAVADSLTTAQGDNYRFLGGELVLLLREAGQHLDALLILDELLQRYPTDVRSAIGKANIYFYSLNQAEQALTWIDVALGRANRTLFFRREALGEKARILLTLGRGEELSDVLEEIMSVQIVAGTPDIGRERDFVDRAPPGFIRKNVLDRYNEFCPKRAGGGSAEEPPPLGRPDRGR